MSEISAADTVMQFSGPRPADTLHALFTAVIELTGAPQHLTLEQAAQLLATTPETCNSLHIIKTSGRVLIVTLQDYPSASEDQLFPGCSICTMLPICDENIDITHAARRLVQATPAEEQARLADMALAASRRHRRRWLRDLLPFRRAR